MTGWVELHRPVPVAVSITLDVAKLPDKVPSAHAPSIPIAYAMLATGSVAKFARIVVRTYAPGMPVARAMITAGSRRAEFTRVVAMALAKPERTRPMHASVREPYLRPMPIAVAVDLADIADKVVETVCTLIQRLIPGSVRPADVRGWGDDHRGDSPC